MNRALISRLMAWLGGEDPRPIVLRGARQVGKTWLVRDLAARSGRTLVELNFERDPGSTRAFEISDPHRVWSDILLARNLDIQPERALLFLDEIQSAPGVLAALRWFAEEMPELRVLAAGSLLDFALADREYSVPVGRISYRHLEPISFDEYLRAHDQDRLLERLVSLGATETVTSTVHEVATEWYERFSMVGGMPAVVSADVEGRTPRECRGLQRDLVATYRDDFAKYVGRMDTLILDRVLLAVANQLGQKFVYARVEDGVKQHQAVRALDLLAKARLVSVAVHTRANGIPLGGDVNPRNRKAVLLDVGIAHALLGTPAAGSFPKMRDLAASVRGQLVEQLSGQQLRVLEVGSGNEPSLYYWQRTGGRPGEIDFIVQVGHRVVPVKLKAGSVGAMKSLHQFMHDKRLTIALRIDTNPPTVQDVNVKTTRGDAVRYRLLNLPGYLLFRSGDLLNEAADVTSP